VNFAKGPQDPVVAQRLREILNSWRGTPYRAGQQRKGVGVDCVRFVCGVYDELQNTETPIQALPGDLALHKPDSARAAMRLLLRSFGGRVAEVGEQIFLSPGDTIVSGMPGGGPGHAMIVGPWPEIWHASRSGVVQTGLGLEGLEFKALVVPITRERWSV